MKKYNIYKLSVVKVREGHNNNYLICEQDYIQDVYIEIFTKEKIRVSNKDLVERFAKYYSLLDVNNLSREDFCMINEQQLLRKYISINNYKNLTTYKADNYLEKQKQYLEILKKLAIDNPDLAKEIFQKSLVNTRLDSADNFVFPCKESQDDNIKKYINV